jgi:molecular chaperone GrpE
MADETKREDEEETKSGKDEQEEQYKERLMRLAAEFDNYKKKVKSETDNAKTFGKAELMKELLPIVDEFEIAMIAVKESGNQPMIKGFELVYSNFMDAMKKSGLSEVKAAGAYDPYRHEIIMTQDEPGRKPGTIISVTKRGYALGDILLRPASVIVARDNVKDAKEDEGK